MTPTFAGVSFASSTRSAASNGRATMPPPRDADHAHRQVRPRKGRFVETPFVPTEERTNRRYPSFSRQGASCPSTTSAHRQEEPRTSPGIRRTSSRSTPTTPRNAAWSTAAGWPWRAARRDRAEGAHHRPRAARGRVHDLPSPGHGRQRRDDQHSDWATNCPEYKVTAVQVRARVHATPAAQSPGLASGPGELRHARPCAVERNGTSGPRPHGEPDRGQFPPSSRGTGHGGGGRPHPYVLAGSK